MAQATSVARSQNARSVSLSRLALAQAIQCGRVPPPMNPKGPTAVDKTLVESLRVPPPMILTGPTASPRRHQPLPWQDRLQIQGQSWKWLPDLATKWIPTLPPNGIQ